MTKRIICVYAESVSGPGWANQPLMVIERDDNGKLSERFIQPEQQGADARKLYAIAEAVHLAMLRAVPPSGSSGGVR